MKQQTEEGMKEKEQTQQHGDTNMDNIEDDRTVLAGNDVDVVSTQVTLLLTVMMSTNPRATTYCVLCTFLNQGQ